MCADAMGSGCVNQVSDAGTEVCRHKENALVHEVGDINPYISATYRDPDSGGHPLRPPELLVGCGRRLAEV